MNISSESAKSDGETFEAVELINAEGSSRVLLICEHASNYFPNQFAQLGLSQEVCGSHIAWDPGAKEVTLEMGHLMNARMIMGKVSRLIYDCNRPPEAADAVPSRSEIFDVPGNQNLTADQYLNRVETCFEPFTKVVDRAVRWSKTPPVLVTIHSFTPIYNGKLRTTDIGILHDTDTRLADAMLDVAPTYSDLKIERNQPYGPEDGVTYTLRKHGIENRLLNVMIEVRNDLIATAEQQRDIAKLLTELLTISLHKLGVLKDGEAC